MFTLNKFSLIITTRCNLRCKLCCEYVPQNKPFPDMTLTEERAILDALFMVVDRVETLHLTGGGEPFLHPQLAQMIDCALEYAEKFGRLMLFTNSTIPIKPEVLDAITRSKEKIIVQLSQYGIKPERERAAAQLLIDNGAKCKTEKYYGEEQSFGGWVDFGKWEPRGRAPDELRTVFNNCAVTRDMRGNWRTRDGKVHWCTRSQRGMELGLLPDNTADYVDLFDNSAIGEKRAKFENISAANSLLACNYCSG
ncbi:MAG: radical SAM protein, partial [Oscillospiraceae bacterium]|nr:radical SAM protein [Oscillospiraceae bacterium]